MAYQSKKVTFDNLANEIKLVNAVSHIDFEKEVTYPGEEGAEDWFYFDADILSKK